MSKPSSSAFRPARSRSYRRSATPHGWPLFVAAFIVGFWAAFEGQANDLIPIFDARPDQADSLEPSRAEATLLEQQVLTVARERWQEECDEEFRIVDAATGSFTRPGASQQAFLYQYCMTGHNFANNGLAIFQGANLVASVAYAGAWENGIGALPDINGNGIAEIIITAGGMNQGIVWQTITVIELSGDEIHGFGNLEVYEDTCESSYEPRARRAMRVFVDRAASPTFYQQEFINTKCEDSGRWLPEGNIHTVHLTEDDIEYVLVR